MDSPTAKISRVEGKRFNVFGLFYYYRVRFFFGWKGGAYYKDVWLSLN